MGIFNLSNPKGTGFAKIPNRQNYTDRDLLDKLSGIKTSLGTPVMGLVGDYEAVLYKLVSFDRLDKRVPKLFSVFFIYAALDRLIKFKLFFHLLYPLSPRPL